MTALLSQRAISLVCIATIVTLTCLLLVNSRAAQSETSSLSSTAIELDRLERRVDELEEKITTLHRLVENLTDKLEERVDLQKIDENKSEKSTQAVEKKEENKIIRISRDFFSMIKGDQFMSFADELARRLFVMVDDVKREIGITA